MQTAPPLSTETSRNPWAAVVVTTLVFFLVVIDVSAVNVAFPSIGDDFEVAESTLGWVISGYNITVASLLLVAGRYADSLDRKHLFIPGVAIFTIGSPVLPCRIVILPRQCHGQPLEGRALQRHCPNLARFSCVFANAVIFLDEAGEEGLE